MRIKRDKFLTALLLINTLTVLLISSESFACKMSKDPKLNYFTSYENNFKGMFYESSFRQHSPTVIERCSLDAGKYLMIALGVRAQTLQSDVSEISFDGQFSPGKCQLNDSLSVSPVNSIATEEFLKKQFSALRACTNIQIYDLDGRNISYNPNQTHCKIQSLGNGVLQLEGDYCFIKINPLNRFAISTNLKTECQSKDFLKQNFIDPMDIEASLNAYVTDDESGSSESVDPLGSSKQRVYIQPDSSLLPLTEDYGPDYPRFSSTFAPDINMGHLNIRGTEGNYIFDMSLEVDNRGQSLCKEGLCSSPQHFLIPIVGEVEFNEVLPSGKLKFIDSWWHAGMAPAQWQGLVRSFDKNLNDISLKKGSRYQLNVRFVDPYEDYQLFAKAMEQFLIDLKGTQGTAGIDMIAPIQGLQSLLGLPRLENLPALRSPDMSSELERVLYVLRTLGQDRQWPAYYDKACNPDLSSCVKPGKSKYYLNVGVSFTVDDFDQNEMKMILKDYEVFKEGKTLKPYRKSTKALPSILCGGN